MEKTEGKELESYRNAADFVCMLGDSLKNVFFCKQQKFDFILLQFDKNPQMIIDKETIMNAKINGIQIFYLFPQYSIQMHTTRQQ